MKKLKANISATIIILYVSFIALCGCAVDTGYVVTTRYKMQKVTETMALYMASVLKSKNPADRNAAALDQVVDSFDKLYSTTSGYYKFKTEKIELKDLNTTSPKVMVTTAVNIPTLFLRFAGIGSIKILQTSYAMASEKTISKTSSDDKSYTYEISSIGTDKRGYDLKIKYPNKYFVFAGIKDYEDNIHWAEIGKGADSILETVSVTVPSGTVQISRVEGERKFDFSKASKPVGLVQFVKIYKDETPAPEEEEEGTTGGGASVTSDPEVTLLNSARLIKRKDF